MYRKVRRALWRVSTLGMSKGPHITRYYMYQHLQAIGDKFLPKTGNLLAISHSEQLVKAIGLDSCKVTSANFPSHNILSLDFPDQYFDYVVSDQVLEHVEGDPQLAIDECARVLRPGGIAIHTTCFINPIHKAPKDFWRFTPDALELLHHDWSHIIEVAGWGNPKVWNIVRDGIRFDGIPHATWHPLHAIAVKNDPLWPIVTWVIAKK